MLLTRPALFRAIEEGRIFVYPFDRSCVNSASIDVRLGQWLYRVNPSAKLLNPWSEKSVRSTWMLCEARTIGDEESCLFPPFEPTQQIIVLEPGETVLAHTQEFIGGADDQIVPSMQARSSIGRSNISVCSCAGLGDVGFHNRWTMELQNRSLVHQVVLPVGFRVAQIVFEEGESTDQNYCDLTGKYQSGSGEELVSKWKPEQMLPRAWKDRELRA